MNLFARMKITNLTTHLLTTQWVDDPSFPQMLHSTAVIRIETDAKIDGLGEATWGYFAPDAVPAMVEYFKPVLLGKDPMEITQLTRALNDDSVSWPPRPLSICQAMRPGCLPRAPARARTRRREYSQYTSLFMQ